MILSDDQWARIEPLLSGKAGDRGVTGKNNRLFIEGVLWICRTGAPWRDLPSEFGHWHTVFTRYNRWSKKGQWQAIFEALCEDPDLEYLMVDGSIARVHQHGAPKKTLKSKKPLANPEVA
jgi:transposase